jgi:hypothetical protein
MGTHTQHGPTLCGLVLPLGEAVKVRRQTGCLHLCPRQVWTTHKPGSVRSWDRGTFRVLEQWAHLVVGSDQLARCCGLLPEQRPSCVHHLSKTDISLWWVAQRCQLSTPLGHHLLNRQSMQRLDSLMPTLPPPSGKTLQQALGADTSHAPPPMRDSSN